MSVLGIALYIYSPNRFIFRGSGGSTYRGIGHCNNVFLLPQSISHCNL